MEFERWVGKFEKFRKNLNIFSKHQRVVGQLLYRSIKIFFPLNKGRLATLKKI